MGLDINDMKKIGGYKRKWDFSEAIDAAGDFDYEKWRVQEEERKKKEEKLRKEVEEKEKARFEAIECPVCHSTEKDQVIERSSNNIIGPGGRSWETENYLVCMNCGIMYKDLKKNEEN